MQGCFGFQKGDSLLSKLATVLRETHKALDSMSVWSG